MDIKPTRPDWFIWLQADTDWCRANAELPGLQFEMKPGGLAVNYHVSHIPCLPEPVQQEHAIVEQARAVSVTLPFERSGLLRGYQFADLQRLKLRRGAILAHEPRLGKTALACHMHNPEDGILLVAGPLAAREAWREWVERTTGFPPFLLYGRKDAAPAPGYGAYFCHYDVLEAHTPFLVTQKIGTFVLDEFHILQNASQRVNAVNACAFRASKILGLSGTPMFNKPKSLYRLLHLLMPGAWGSRHSFMLRYADAQPGAHGWIYEGQSNPDELAERLATCMARRTWQGVMPELPPTTRVIEPVEIAGSAYVAIEAAAMKAALASGTASELGYQAALRRKLAEVKIKPALEIARRAAADGHKVVLWRWLNEIGEKLVAAFHPDERVFQLRREDDGFKRERIRQEFHDYPGPAFMVASMGVGGVALDLSASDYAIFVELDWTPAVVAQAAMRTFHKSRPHVVVFLYADDPVEARLIEALDVKNNFAAAVGLGSDEIVRKVFST